MELLVFGVVILVGGIYIAWLRHTLFWLRKDLEWAKSRRDEACRQWDKFQVWWGEASDERHILRQ